MALCIVDDILLLDAFVNAQHGNIILAVDGLVLYQCHVRHGDKGRNIVADGQLGRTASCLLLVK